MTPKLDNLTPSAIDQGIEAAVSALISSQTTEGFWNGLNYGGPIYTAFTLIVEHYLSILSTEDASQGLRWMRTQQLPDGSFPGYPMASSGTLAASATVYAAMLLAGASPEDEDIIRAKRFIDGAGGFGATDPITHLYLALAGLLPAEKLPGTSLLFRLIPGIDRTMGRRFAILLNLMFNQLPLIIAGLRDGKNNTNPWLHPLDTLARKSLLHYLTRRQNPEGNWAGILMPTLLGLLCLHFLNLPADDQRVTRAKKSLKRWKQYSSNGMQVVPFCSEIWCTALATRALMLSGLETDHPAVAKGLDYLVQTQSRLTEPKDWQNPPRNAPRTGAWAFEADNPLCPDPDTSGAVLWTLGLAMDKGAPAQVQEAARKGLTWELAMHNPDGGWPGMAYGLRSKAPGPLYDKPMVLPKTPLELLKLFIKPPVEFGDPATADLTGRVLCGLKYFDYRKGDPVVDKAIGFCRYQRNQSGVWWGRWAVNYLFGSSYVLCGLKAIGEDMEAPYVQQAVAWVTSQQNEDGGWGECVESYTDLSLAGKGVSQASLTGQVVSALIDAGQADQPSVREGVAYLLSQQTDDGYWKEEQAAYVMVPPDTFYTNFEDSQYGPIEALTKYRSFLANT